MANIKIDVQKVLAGLLPGLGLLTLAFPSFLGTPSPNSPGLGNQPNADGHVEAKVVVEVFVRTGRIMHVHVGGQVIRTTVEHPFWVYH